MQRNGSLQLHELSIVNKHNNNEDGNSKLSQLEESTHGDLNGNEFDSKKKIQTKRIVPPMRKISDKKDDLEIDTMLYRLASKKREISELEHQLHYAKQELRNLEEQFKKISTNENNGTDRMNNESRISNSNSISNLTSKLLLNDSSNVVATNARNMLNNAKTMVNTKFNTDTSNNNIANSKNNGSFFQRLKKTIDEFNADEDEFDEHVTKNTTRDTEFYLKASYDVSETELQARDEEDFRFWQSQRGSGSVSRG